MSQNKKYSKRRKQQSPWPLALLVSGGLLLILGAAFAFAQSAKPKATIEVSGAPALKVDQEEVNLGDVKLGTTVEASFKITNVGDKTLVFAKAPFIEVREGC